MSHHVVSASECMRDKLLVGCSEFPEPGADPDTQYDTEMAAAYSARAGLSRPVATTSRERAIRARSAPSRSRHACGVRWARRARHPQGLKAPT